MNLQPGQVVEDFVAAFAHRDVQQLAPYLDADVVFEAYGDSPVHGRDALLAIWQRVFESFAEVDFSTLHQAVNGEVVLEEQVHGLALPGRQLAPIRNVAVYRVHDGLITEWRDYSNPQYAQTLL
jgi:limonene-1,2-epoxide hydrolase